MDLKWKFYFQIFVAIFISSSVFQLKNLIFATKKPHDIEIPLSIHLKNQHYGRERLTTFRGNKKLC